MSGPMAEWSAGGQTLAHAQRSAAAVFAIRVAGAACAYGSQVLLARLMGKEGYGVFATTWVWILVLGHIAVFGLAQSVCSFVPAYRARNEIELARGFLAWGAAGTLGAATAMAALGALALWFAQGSINEAYSSGVQRAGSSRPRRRSASCSRACGVRRASRSCAAARASPRRCIMAGRRTSWRRARSGSPATPPRVPRLTRGKARGGGAPPLKG